MEAFQILVDRLDDLVGLAQRSSGDFEKAAVYAATQAIKVELLSDSHALNSYARDKVVTVCWHVCAAVGYDIDNEHSAVQHVSWAYGEISTLRNVL